MWSSIVYKFFASTVVVPVFGAAISVVWLVNAFADSLDQVLLFIGILAAIVLGIVLLLFINHKNILKRQRNNDENGRNARRGFKKE